MLNKYSTVQEIHEFIYNEFGKVPLIEPISKNELSEDKYKEYEPIMTEYSEPASLLSEWDVYEHSYGVLQVIDILVAKRNSLKFAREDIPQGYFLL